MLSPGLEGFPACGEDGYAIGTTSDCLCNHCRAFEHVFAVDEVRTLTSGVSFAGMTDRSIVPALAVMRLRMLSR